MLCLVWKMPAVLQITLLMTFRCAVDVHLIAYNFARLRFAENHTLKKKKKNKQNKTKTKTKTKQNNTGNFKCTMPPDFVIPCNLSTLYRCSLTTLAQDKPYHDIPLGTAATCNHKGSCTLFRTYLTITVRVNSSNFVQVSTKQLAVSSKGISSHSIFKSAFILMGLELATSRTQSKHRIDWANLTVWSF